MLTLHRRSLFNRIDRRFVALPVLFLAGYLASLAVLTRIAPPPQPNDVVTVQTPRSTTTPGGSSTNTQTGDSQSQAPSVAAGQSQSPAWTGSAAPSSSGTSNDTAATTDSGTTTDAASTDPTPATGGYGGGTDTQTGGNTAGSGTSGGSTGLGGIKTTPILSPLYNL